MIEAPLKSRCHKRQANSATRDTSTPLQARSKNHVRFHPRSVRGRHPLFLPHQHIHPLAEDEDLAPLLRLPEPEHSPHDRLDLRAGLRSIQVEDAGCFSARGGVTREKRRTARRLASGHVAGRGHVPSFPTNPPPSPPPLRRRVPAAGPRRTLRHRSRAPRASPSLRAAGQGKLGRRRTQGGGRGTWGRHAAVTRIRACTFSRLSARRRAAGGGGGRGGVGDAPREASSFTGVGSRHSGHLTSVRGGGARAARVSAHVMHRRWPQRSTCGSGEWFEAGAQEVS